MELTRQEAIDKTIELWTWLAETGLGKTNWPGWPDNEWIMADCFLCEYATFFKSCKENCPYHIEFGLCYEEGSPYVLWRDSIDVSNRKKYANLFLEQLKELD